MPFDYVTIYFIEFRYNRCNFRIRLNAEKHVPEARKNSFKDKTIEVPPAYFIRIKLMPTK